MRIEDYRFGFLQMDGRRFTQDLKVAGERIVSPWWRQSGHTVHVQDVRDLLDLEPDVLLLGQGQPGMMQASPELRTELERRGIRLIERPTAQAVHTFNEMRSQGISMGAGFHLTC